MINLTNLDKEKFEDIVKFWNDRFPMMAMEECGELIQAVSKYERALHIPGEGKELDKKCEEKRENLIEEIRDMYISLECLKIMYNIDDNELNGEIEKKIK